jgi:hypothetical protein
LDANVIRTPHGGADRLNERKNLLFRKWCPRRADRVNGAVRAEETIGMHHLSDVVRRDLLSSPLRLLSGMQSGSRSLKRRIRKKCEWIMNDKGTKRATHPSLTKKSPEALLRFIIFVGGHGGAGVLEAAHFLLPKSFHKAFNLASSCS